MGLFQKIFNLVKEELLDEPRKGAPKKRLSQAMQEENDSFEQLCAKAKSGDLAAQSHLYQQFANRSDKYEALEALFTEMMNNGDVEGKGLLAALLATKPENAGKSQKLTLEAFNEGSLFITALNGIVLATPRGLRRDWNPEITDKRLFVCPVNYNKAIPLLEKAAEKLEHCSEDVQTAYREVYGYLAYCYGYTGNESALYKYAFLGSELGDPVANIKMFTGYLYGDGEFEQNIDYALAYGKKIEKQKDYVLPPLMAYYYTHLARYYYKKDNEKAFKYYEKAAKLGGSLGMAWLSAFYQNGVVVEKDVDEAIKWRNKATKAGYNWSKDIFADGCI